jgi:hypothetical protein
MQYIFRLIKEALALHIVIEVSVTQNTHETNKESHMIKLKVYMGRLCIYRECYLQCNE